jgi:hypothetical protein
MKQPHKRAFPQRIQVVIITTIMQNSRTANPLGTAKKQYVFKPVGSMVAHNVNLLRPFRAALGSYF